MNAVYNVTTRGKQLLVYEDRVVIIVQKTAMNFLQGNYTDGSKTIYYADMIAIQYKKPGLQVGYILFETASAKSSTKGNYNRRNRMMNNNFLDEHTVRFDNKIAAVMNQIIGYVENKIGEYKRGGGVVNVQQTISPAEELRKFKELLDMGVISPQEFDVKKRELLGIQRTG